MKEEEIIQLFYEKGRIPSDDCDYHENTRLLLSTDSLVESTHFRLDWSKPGDVARKLVEVNVSDIVSSGGIPHSIYLNLGLNAISGETAWIRSFSREFSQAIEDHNLKLRGGDTFRSTATALSVTILGNLHDKLNSPLVRSRSRVGDNIYCTGVLGLSQLGWEILKNPSRWKDMPQEFQDLGLNRHLRPRSLNGILDHILNYEIHSCMDITDGLIQDLPRLALASGVGFQLFPDKLPMWKELGTYLSPGQILTSGEELELVFTSPDHIPEKLGPYHITNIGKVISKKNEICEYFIDENKLTLQEEGFLHF